MRYLDRSMPVIEERLKKLNPPPLRDPLPVLIGGGGERVTLRIVAEHAHIWNGFGDPEKAGRKSEILDDLCHKVGRDPKEIERSITIRPNQVKNADRYVENGITHLLLGFGGPYYDLTPLEELVAWRDDYRERNPEAAGYPALIAPSRSEIRSSLSSMPTERRIRPSVTPRASRCSLGVAAWVIVAGCVIRDSTPPRDSAKWNNFVLRIVE